jgi:hypothetical protein
VVQDPQPAVRRRRHSRLLKVVDARWQEKAQDDRANQHPTHNDKVSDRRAGGGSDVASGGKRRRLRRLSAVGSRWTGQFNEVELTNRSLQTTKYHHLEIDPLMTTSGPDHAVPV